MQDVTGTLEHTGTVTGTVIAEHAGLTMGTGIVWGTTITLGTVTGHTSWTGTVTGTVCGTTVVVMTGTCVVTGMLHDIVATQSCGWPYATGPPQGAPHPGPNCAAAGSARSAKESSTITAAEILYAIFITTLPFITIEQSSQIIIKITI
jgi:hypothetical protein